MAAELDARGLPRKAARHRDCHRSWNRWGCSSGCTRKWRVLARCEVRICPTCASRYGAKVAAELKDVLAELRASRRLPVGWRLRLVTLPVRTERGNLAAAVQCALRALPLVWRKVLRCPKAGAVASLEAGAQHGNVHLHLLYLGPWVDQVDLSREWKRLTGSSVVDVREVRDAASGIAEVAKYATAAHLVKNPRGVEIAAELEAALHGRRRIRSYGVFYGRTTDAPEEDNPGTSCDVCGEPLQLLSTLDLPWPPPLRARAPP